MIGSDVDVKPRIEKTGVVAGKDIALRLASCGAKYRPQRSPPSQLGRGKSPYIPQGRACPRLRRHPALRLHGASGLPWPAIPWLSLADSAGRLGPPLSWPDRGLTLAGQPRALCAPVYA